MRPSRRPFPYAVVLRVVVGILITAVMAYTLRGMHLSPFVHALRDADGRLTALAILLNFSLMALKGIVWWLLLGTRHPVPLVRLWRYTLAAFGLSLVMPFRAGEALRIGMLRAQEKVPAPFGLAVTLLDKWLHVVALLLCVMWLPYAMPDLPPWVLRGLIALAAGGLGGSILLYVGARTGARRVPEAWRPALALIIERPGRLAAATLVLVVLWLADCALLLTSARAVHLPLTLSGALFVVFVLNMAIAVPSVPGQLGVLELGVVAGLDVLGIAREPALAFGLFYHAVQLIPLFAVTLLDARFILKSLRSLRSAKIQS